ncbi:MAG: transcriptional regulator [Gammaproteobacteria bacterium]|nr:MAG: transcriptional regulator [Gammaproteobacteria bacterium]RLA24684.1 MAG: transcriptional regulator [Gammaproteobacteria bacterium]
MTISEELQSYKNLSVGDRLPEIKVLVDQNMVDAYADASGDTNPLHIDPEFAKTTFFGRTIAHGLLTLAFVSQVLSEWNWQGWAYGGELSVAFLGPVYPGDEVSVSGEIDLIEQREEGVFARCNLACYCGERAVVKGTATCKVG